MSSVLSDSRSKSIIWIFRVFHQNRNSGKSKRIPFETAVTKCSEMFIVPSLRSSFLPQVVTAFTHFFGGFFKSKQRRRLTSNCFARELEHQISSLRTLDLGLFGVKPGSHMPPTYLGREVIAGTAWDRQRCGICEQWRRPIICPRHWSPACLRSWTQLNFAVKPVVNAWYRLCVGDKFSRMPQLSQAVPAAMPRLGQWQMRTRLNSAGSYGGEGEKMGRVPRGVARKSTSKGLRYRYLLSVFQIDKDFIFLRVICKRRKRRE